MPRPLCLLILALLVGPLGPVAAAQDLARNPIIWADVPDPSTIRVGDTYYMSSTTMHMAPGVPILKSPNLVDWELAGYVYDELANADALFQRQGQNAYGRGSWASSLRYHDGTFYLAVFSYTTGETYIYTTGDVENGPWHKESLGDLYHDQSLFFDDDGRVYLIYGGGGDFQILELEADASAVKRGGVDRVLVQDVGSPAGDDLGLHGEGAQLFKVDGTYYLFLIAWPRGGMRTVVVQRAESLDGPWEGRAVLQDDGVAQGGIVDTPDGDWYALMFGDRGAVGRIPYLIPVTWSDDGWPVLGVDGGVPETLDIVSDGTGASGIVASDAFDGPELRPEWQFNHNPESRLWSLTERPGYFRIRTGRRDRSFVDARNSLTQRTFGPESGAETALDVSGLNDGDIAGLGLLAADYGYVGVMKEDERTSVVMVAYRDGEAQVVERVPVEGDVVHLRAHADFRDQRDEGTFFYSLDGEAWTPIGDTLAMRYTLEHFMGYRFALFAYATETPGGTADFDYFRLDPAP
ncbi:glycoside hydrolase family 43 protein [Rubrivirga marina]|uniref:Glycoside hydrolase n=1 Tax=Rubrivirga marina TaxID=1196024 RepID=A0A271IUX1_9BACT|nr:glycoside hydrolase 43 family protein [Rubrivirga marina]PAP75036.1 glycoside hydrolase [Rubrivirga marina]